MGRPRKTTTEEMLDENGLTAAQEAYCRSRAAGRTANEAYRDAHGDDATNVTVKAREYDDLDKVRLRIKSLRDQVSENLIVELEEIKADLTKIATDENRPDGVRLKAYDQITRMIGGYQDRLEVSGQFGVQERVDALSALMRYNKEPSRATVTSIPLTPVE